MPHKWPMSWYICVRYISNHRWRSYNNIITAAQDRWGLRTLKRRFLSRILPPPGPPRTAVPPAAGTPQTGRMGSHGPSRLMRGALRVLTGATVRAVDSRVDTAIRGYSRRVESRQVRRPLGLEGHRRLLKAGWPLMSFCLCMTGGMYLQVWYQVSVSLLFKSNHRKQLWDLFFNKT